MIANGLMIMLVGMGTVFVFLGLLVGLMKVSASFFSSWPDDPLPQKAPVRASSMGRNKETDELIHIAIALAAIEQKRS